MREHARKDNFRFALRVIALLANGLAIVFLTLTLLIAGAAYFFLPKFLDSTRVRTLLVERLEDSLHRPASIGQIVFAPSGVKVSGVEIANANPGEGDLFDGDSATLSIKILPLFERRLEIKTVRIFHPVIRLVRDKDGRWDFADIFHSSGAAKAPQPLFLSMPVSLKADKTVIEDAAIIFDDRYRKRTITFSGINLTIKDPDAVRPFPFVASFVNTFQFQDRRITASCNASGTATLGGLDLSSALISASQVTIDAGGAVFNGTLRLRNFFHPFIAANFLAPVLGPAWISEQIGRPTAFSWPQSRWNFILEFPSASLMRIPALSVTAEAFSAAANGNVNFSSSPFNLDADISVSSATLQNFSYLAPAITRDQIRGQLQAHISISGPWDKLRADKADIHLNDFSANFKPLSITAKSFSIASSGNFSKLSILADEGSLQTLGHSFTNVSLRTTLIKNRLSVSRLSFNWAGGRAMVSGSINDLRRPNQIQVEASADSLHWNEAQKLTLDIAAYLSKRRHSKIAPPSPARQWVAFFKYHIPRQFPATSGHLKIGAVTDKNFWFKNASIVWNLRGITPRLNTADGDVRLGLGPGHFDNLQSIVSSSTFMEVLFLPYVYMHKMNSFSVLSAATAYPDTFDFKRIGGEYGVHNGLVRTRFFHVDSPQLAAFAQGEADFAKETVDMEVLTRLSHYDAPLPEWWVDELGRPAIGFWVKGSLDHPSIEPRLQKMGANEIEEALAKAEARAQTRLPEENK